MELKCGSQPFLVLHHFIMSKHITAKHRTASITSKNDEMIALSESSLVWIFFARLRKQTGPNNLQGPQKKMDGPWKANYLVSCFFHTQKKQRKIQQIQRPASSKQVLATLAQTCNSCPRTRYQQVTNVRPVDFGRDA